MCLNSFILHKKLDGKLKRIEFLLKLDKQLIENNSIYEREIPCRNRAIINPTRLHAPLYTKQLEKNNSNKQPKKKCRVCSRCGVRRGTKYIFVKKAILVCAQYLVLKSVTLKEI